MKRKPTSGPVPSAGITRVMTGTWVGAELTAEEVVFGRAMDDYKRHHTHFPDYAQVLAVARAMGYRRVAEPAAIPGCEVAGISQEP